MTVDIATLIDIRDAISRAIVLCSGIDYARRMPQPI